MRDLRDPQAIGNVLMQPEYANSMTITEAADVLSHVGIVIPLVLEADGVYVGPLERYGDPRARHEAGR